MKRTRWRNAVSAIVIMVFTGLIYAWSVFVIPLEAEFGWTRPQTSLTFSISMGAFCMGGMLGGILIKRYASRVLMCMAAFFVLAGFFLASGIDTLAGLYVCYGLLCGFGVGLCYNLVMNATLKWFPDKQGLLSGMLLMGFGFGGSIFSSAAVALMQCFGWRSTFVFFGIGSSAIIILGSIKVALPSESQLKELKSSLSQKTVTGAEFNPEQMVKDRTFMTYYLWAVFLSAAGLALIGNAAPFAKTMTDNMSTAAFAAGLISILNGVGRLIFGLVFDRIGSRKCLIIINLSFIFSALVLLTAVKLNSFAILTLGFICAGFSYGGITPLNSAFIGKVYGQKYFAVNFSIITTVVLVAAFMGPYTAGFLYGLSGSYMSIILIMLVFGGISLPNIFLIKRNTKPETAVLVNKVLEQNN